MNSDNWKIGLASINKPWPVWDDKFLSFVAAMFPNATSMRRDITLARLTIALARIKGQIQITNADVIDAAELLGVIPEAKRYHNHISYNQDTIDGDKDIEPFTDISEPQSVGNLSEPSKLLKKDVDEVISSKQESDIELFDNTDILIEDLYPEDKIISNHDIYSLQIPISTHKFRIKPQGVHIGVKSATTLSDIAIVPTILSSIIYQPIRRSKKGKLKLFLSDLKSYRRLTVSKSILILLIDYTSLKEVDLEKVLEYHFQWAYKERSPIVIIQVGIEREDALYELRAYKIEMKNVLSPNMAKALNAFPGKATPLAHGFELVLKTLQNILNRGRNTINAARLVILTDGRGNVPLNASYTLNYPYGIKREGIEDTLSIADKIRDFQRLESFVISPLISTYVNLPLNIAGALDASFEVIDTYLYKR
ncbi:hypothetical protein SE18_10960 [Herpetosiphon geysericola]|uniref:Uncharacterized protein n=2 Tax=Herpetosiphon geysericola TaxID=70996 RepID=A0A0P6YBM3_9CHLR|nr:hypothetical protein SE18_10960 [Herpetosiphon geysericola]